MSALDTIGQSLSEGFGMFWETLWALVLGFALSGAVQAFVSRAEMQRALGGRTSSGGHGSDCLPTSRRRLV